MYKLILLFIPVFLFSGCAFVFTDVNTRDFSGIAAGMTSGQVISALGEPLKRSSETVSGKEFEIWTYPAVKIAPSDKTGRIGVNDYEVLFAEGKVDQWRKTRTIAQPGYEAPTKAIREN